MSIAQPEKNATQPISTAEIDDAIARAVAKHLRNYQRRQRAKTIIASDFAAVRQAIADCHARLMRGRHAR